MSSQKIKFDFEKLNKILSEDGRSASKIAEDAKINRKTFKSACEGKPIRQYTAERIAKEFKTDVSRLVSDVDVARVANSQIQVDLTNIELTEGASVHNSSYSPRREGILTKFARAYPSESDEIMSTLQGAGVTWFNPIEPRKPSPYWYVAPGVKRNEEFLEALNQLDAAFARDSSIHEGARDIKSLVANLKAGMSLQAV